MSLDSINFNLSVRHLIASLERGDKQMEALPIQFERYAQIKDKIGQREHNLDSDLCHRYEILKASFDFEYYLNPPLKRKSTTPGNGKRQRVSKEKVDLQPIVEYKKFEYRTAYLVPTLKQYHAEGCNGKVFTLDKKKLAEVNPKNPLLKIRHDLLVKKSKNNSLKEFRTGNTLSHKNLVKSYCLFVKESDEKKTFKIVMEKIDGTTLRNIELVEDTILIKRFINNTKDCCLYLFDQEYIWSDCHNENIIVETHSGELKFIDYETWKKAKNHLNLTKSLLTECESIIDYIFLKTIFSKKRAHLNHQNFGNEISPDYSREQLRDHVESYFNVILQKFDEIIHNPNAFEDIEDEESEEWSFSSSE